MKAPSYEQVAEKAARALGGVEWYNWLGYGRAIADAFDLAALEAAIRADERERLIGGPSEKGQ